MLLDKNFYPGFTRKAITFTIDDGNITYDTKFISIVKPCGIFGTFNLVGVDLENHSADFYRELYSGFGIANHCKRHPFALDPNKEYLISEEPFNRDLAPKDYLHKTDIEGLYHYPANNGWRLIATKDTYLKLVDKAQEELESVFGEGNVQSYVWPYYEQKDATILDALLARGYRSVRKTGEVKDSTGFALPKDRAKWSYNANHLSLLQEAAKFDAFPDDGELKFFAFGVHSIDFERDNLWGDLEKFAMLYGNRREDFYYASVDDIFDYEDALNKLEVIDGYLKNNSNIPLYVKLNGDYVIIEGGVAVKV